MFSYNGVQLALHKSRLSFGEERDPSNTDVLWGTYTINVSGIAITGESLGTPSITTLREVEHLLIQPGKPLVFAPCGQQLLATAGRDVQFGPKLAGPIRVEQFTSDAVFVDATYEVRLRTCQAGNTDPVVSLRWEQSSSFDELWYERRTTSGRLIVRSDMRQLADNFRELCTPSVPSNYRRVAASYRLSRSGTELDFDFADQEQSVLPPAGARKASGTFAVLVQKGSKRFGQVSVKLESGPESIGRDKLMALAIKMAFSKLQAEGFGKVVAGARYTLLDGRFSESLFDQSVELSLSAQLPPLAGVVTAGGVLGAPVVMESVGTTGIETPVDGLAPPVYSRVKGLIAAAFRDPCAARDARPELNPAPGGNKPKGPMFKPANDPFGGYNPNGTRSGFSLSVGDLPPTGTNVVADLAPYTHYEINSEYHEDTGAAVLPATGVGPNGAKAAAVTLHGGITKMVVSWTASRTGTPPVLPAKQTQDANFVLLTAVVIPDGIEIGADGVSPVYCVSGTYTYGVIDPGQINYAAPVPPFLSPLVSAAAALAAGFTTTAILGQQQGQPAPIPGQQPNNTLATQLGAGLLAILNATGSAQQPPGGLDSGSGSGGVLGGNPEVYP